MGIIEAAKLKKISYITLAKKISKLKGPKFVGTKTKYIKLHDDKSLYTGVYAKGGPSIVDKGKS